jgi:hypothetical protein
VNSGVDLDHTFARDQMAETRDRSGRRDRAGSGCSLAPAGRKNPGERKQRSP